MKVWILIFVCMFSMPSVGCSIAFQDEKRADSENKAGLCENARYFGRSFSALGGKMPFRK